MQDPQAPHIQQVIELILAEQRMELVELSCVPQGRQLAVRLLVDAVGGVTIQECARVNQLIGRALDAANLIEGSYVVEVSSPGLDRPLAARRDFERALGEELSVEMMVGEGRTREYRGVLLAVQPDAVVVNTTSGPVTVPLGEIRRAVKAIRWSK